MRWPILALMAFVLLFIAGQTTAQNGARYPESFQITKNGTTVLLEDYASAPRSAPSFPPAAAPTNDFEGLPYQLARVNVLTSEPAVAPGAASRFFVVDQNGRLYTLEKRTRQFTPYIDFSKAFPNFANAGPHGGFGTGLGSVAFDPAYARNGKFYTAHTEKPKSSQAGTPSNVHWPGLDATGYTTTAAINNPERYVRRDGTRTLESGLQLCLPSYG